MKVVGYRLLIIPDEVETVSKGGIHVVMDTDKAKLSQMYGTVYQIGDQCWNETPDDPWCKVGDKVAWSKYASKFVRDAEGKEYVILNDVDIVAVIEES